MLCTDWEMAQSYRAWRRQYGDKWEDAFRQRYEAEMIAKTTPTFLWGRCTNIRRTGLSLGFSTRQKRRPPTKAGYLRRKVMERNWMLVVGVIIVLLIIAAVI